MFPRRSNQSAWGVSGDSDSSLKMFAVVGAGFLILGAILGWAFHGNGGKGETKKNPEAIAVINASVDDVLSAPKTEAGATKAVTSFITGLPQFSLETPDKQTSTIGKLMAPTATVELVNNVTATVALMRQDFIGAPGLEHQPTAKVVVSPVTYKTTMTAADKANVQLWYMMTMIDIQGKRVENNWTSASIDLVWTDHWRVANFVANSGPTPPLTAAPAQASSYDDLVKVFDGFRAYRSAVG